MVENCLAQLKICMASLCKKFNKIAGKKLHVKKSSCHKIKSICTETDRQTNRWFNIQKDGWMDRHTDNWTDRILYGIGV